MSINVKVIWVNVLLTLWSSSKISGQSSNRRIAIPNNPCIGLPNEILTNNSRGCEYFFYCRNGEAIEGFCPNNMWFNIDAGICDQPKNVYCTFDGNPSNADGNAENEDERVSCSLNIPTQIEQFIPSKIDCGRYFICYHGQPIRQHCISDLHWNVVENKCDQPNNARCQIESSTPSPPQQSICSESANIFLPHPSECEYFIYCQNGMASIQQCPFNHHWDTLTESCKWRQFAVCNSKRN